MRRLKGNERAAGPLYIVAGFILLVLLAVVFLLQPAYFLALVVIAVGAGILLFGRAHPVTLAVGGILLVGGMALAIITALSASLHGFSFVVPYLIGMWG